MKGHPFKIIYISVRESGSKYRILRYPLTNEYVGEVESFGKWHEFSSKETLAEAERSIDRRESFVLNGEMVMV
jgi:hypothetical protein